MLIAKYSGAVPDSLPNPPLGTKGSANAEPFFSSTWDVCARALLNPTRARRAVGRTFGPQSIRRQICRQICR